MDESAASVEVRGAESIDKDRRRAGENWWPDEELGEAMHHAVLAAYSTARPRIVITHDCPTEIVPMVATLAVDKPPSRTNALLQAMLELHAPQMWLFGHHHRNWVHHHQLGTTFIYIGELGYFDFDDSGAAMMSGRR